MENTEQTQATDEGTPAPDYGLAMGQAGGYPLRRSRHGRMIAGVAAGLARYLDLDVTLVRIGFVILAFVGGLAVPAYIAAWLLIPEDGCDASYAEDLLHRHRHPMPGDPIPGGGLQ